jgi:hypothetical protein
LAYSKVSIQYFNDTAPITQVAELEIMRTTQLVGNQRGVTYAGITALSEMTITFIFTLLMYKLLAVITDDTGRKTGHSTSLIRI